jgi:hypothetical protein
METDIAANTAKVSNVTTNLGVTTAATTVTVTSSDGTDAVLPAATTTVAGVMTGADKTKLDGIAAGAEVNVNADWNAVSGDAEILNKPTIPTQASLSVDDLITLTGVAEGSVNLGTFTGTTITDNVTIKVALQELETAVEATASTSMGGLSDVTLTSTTSGDFLRYNGAAWVNTPLVAGDIPALDAAKITTGTFADARIAESNVTQHQAALSITESQISDLQSYLTSVALNDVTDVTITTAATGDFLRYNGAAWVDTTLVAGDIPNLDAAKITTGTFADARISESSVTQHQAALSITESQISDLQAYALASQTCRRMHWHRRLPRLIRTSTI